MASFRTICLVVRARATFQWSLLTRVITCESYYLLAQYYGIYTRDISMNNSDEHRTYARANTDNDNERDILYSDMSPRVANGLGNVLCGNSGYRHIPDLLRFAMADSILTYCRWIPTRRCAIVGAAVLPFIFLRGYAFTSQPKYVFGYLPSGVRFLKNFARFSTREN